MDETKLQAAVYRFYEALNDFSHYPGSYQSSYDPKSVDLFHQMEKAETAMFDAAGIDHGRK